MPEDLESILRKSLDEVDRDRKRMKRTFAILAIPLLAAIVVQGYISTIADIKFLLVYSVAILFLAEVGLALRTWMIVADSTRKVLKAIELLSRQ